MFKKLSFGAIALLIALLPLQALTTYALSTNLILNPSLETSSDAATPDGWKFNTWGTNDGKGSYVATDRGHSIQIDMSSYASGTAANGDPMGGAADWYTDIPVTAGATYQYSNWYKSTTNTQIDVSVINGTTETWNATLGAAPASATWTQFNATYTVPVGATTIRIFQALKGSTTTPLAATISLTTDDYSFVTYTPTPFTRPIVSITFDDGWANQNTNAAPTMKANGFLGTYYIISNEVKDASPVDGSDYMTRAQVKALFDGGNEIGSHTLDHCEMTTGLTEPGGPACPGFNLDTEMRDSQSVLNTLTGGQNVTDFAYPYGSFNATTIAAGKPYYASQRSVVRGYNTKDGLDATKLKIYEVDTTNTTAEVKSWINGAISENAWLVLVYHEIADKAAAGDSGYNVKTADFAAQMAYLKSTNVAVLTIAQALAEVQVQLGGVVLPPTVKPGDVNGDGTVDGYDLDPVLRNWNKTTQTKAQGDLNGDGMVDGYDLDLVLRNWSK